MRAVAGAAIDRRVHPPTDIITPSDANADPQQEGQHYLRERNHPTRVHPRAQKITKGSSMLLFMFTRRQTTANLVAGAPQTMLGRAWGICGRRE